MSVDRVDFAAINASLDADQVVPQWLPDGKRQGREWVARNPNRADRTPGSFSVNLATCKWADFAADVTGGDLVSLYAYLFHRNDQGAAARALSDGYAIRTDAAPREPDPAVRRIDDAKPTPIFPVPVGVAEPDFNHFRFGAPTCVHTYRDAQSRVLMYVARFDPEGMPRKQIVPLTWCNDPKRGGERWAWRGITGNAKVPLYGLDQLAARPDDPVMVVEGEKTADAASAFIRDFVVVAWLGGTQRAGSINLKPLKGRSVTLWPDFDAAREKLTDDEAAAGVSPDSKPLLRLHEQGGMVAMMEIAQALKGEAQLSMVGYTPGEFEHGFDLADGWDEAEAMDYLRANAGDPWDIISGRKVRTDAKPRFVRISEPMNIYGFPDVSKKQQPLSTIDNIAFLMQEYGITARYNEVKKAVELEFPGIAFYGDTRHENALNQLSSLCSKNMMPKGDLQAYVKNIASDNAYSPVRDWVESKPWDGVSRIADLQGTLTTPADNVELKNALVYRWLLSAIAAAYSPKDFEAHGALVFTGPQGEGKTTWFRKLAPSDMGVVLVGASVDPADKDSVTKVVGHWIVELGELDATFRKADIARLKAFVTQPVDKLRRPYDRLESEYKRRTIFGGSVNEDRYLVDDTGNRRWWTVPVTKVDYQHAIDMQQLWAEMLTHYRNGEQWWLTREENDALKILNAQHEAIDPVEELILSRFDFDKSHLVSRCEMTASDVLRWIGYDRPNKAATTHCAKVLKALVGEPRKTASQRLYSLPPRKNMPIDDGSRGDPNGPF